MFCFTKPPECDAKTTGLRKRTLSKLVFNYAADIIENRNIQEHTDTGQHKHSKIRRGAVRTENEGQANERVVEKTIRQPTKAMRLRASIWVPRTTVIGESLLPLMPGNASAGADL